MQVDASSVQLSATISELIEHMRQAAYTEGQRAASASGREDPVEHADGAADVLTLIRIPMPSSWGEYHPAAGLILLADDLPAEIRKNVIRELLAEQDHPREEPSERPICV